MQRCSTTIDAAALQLPTVSQHIWICGGVLAQREMEKRRSPLVHRFRPFGGGGFFEALGVYRPMTLRLRGAKRARVRSRGDHVQPGPFSVFCPSPRFPVKIWRQDRFRATIANSLDLEHPPVGPSLG
jgi:hypothetical protein